MTTVIKLNPGLINRLKAPPFQEAPTSLAFVAEKDVYIRIIQSAAKSVVSSYAIPFCWLIVGMDHTRIVAHQPSRV